MPTYYKVQQGDYLAKIAQQFGFTDYNTIWNDSHNAQLKQKRQSPNVLYPGDILYIPDKADKQLSKATSQSHTFVVPDSDVTLQIVLDNVDFKPLAGADYVLTLPNQTVAATADGSGLLKQDISVIQTQIGTQTQAGTLEVQNQKEGVDVEAGILIAYLNPLTYPSGQMARLNNMGYFAGKQETGDAMDEQVSNEDLGHKPPNQWTGTTIDPKELNQFQSAIEEFQCDQMGPSSVDGICGPGTQSKMKQFYGC